MRAITIGPFQRKTLFPGFDTGARYLVPGLHWRKTKTHYENEI